MISNKCKMNRIIVKIDGDFAKFCGLLRIYELYQKPKKERKEIRIRKLDGKFYTGL